MGKGPGPRASEPHDIVPGMVKTGGGGCTSDALACRWPLVEALASRVMRGHQVAFGNRSEGSIHADGSELRRHERHGLTRRSGSDQT